MDIKRSVEIRLLRDSRSEAVSLSRNGFLVGFSAWVLFYHHSFE